MADAQERANTQPEVEIDLDDVKETNVQVEETKQEESKEPNLNSGEVDLGYTDHDKEQPKEEEIDIKQLIKERADQRLKQEQEAYDQQFGTGGIAQLKRPI